MQWSATTLPSMNIASRSRVERSRPKISASLRLVPSTKRRDTDDLDVARASTLPTGSSPAGYRRVDSPASIFSRAARV